MADATRSKVYADHLEDAITKLTASQLAMNTKIDYLLQRMTQLEANQQQLQFHHLLRRDRHRRRTV